MVNTIIQSALAILGFYLYYFGFVFETGIVCVIMLFVWALKHICLHFWDWLTEGLNNGE